MSETHRNQQFGLIQVLGKKLRLYADFLSATRLLKEAIEVEDIVKVAQLTRQRGDIIRLVEGLDRQIQYSVREEGGSPKRALITDALNKVLRQIIQSNEACESAASRKCDVFKSDLAKLRHKRKAISGYGSKAFRNPKFLDVQT